MSVNSTIFEPVTENVQFMDIHIYFHKMSVNSTIFEPVTENVQFMDIHDFEIEPPPRSPIYSQCFI